MRGTPAAVDVAQVAVGIIPAYAGNTTRRTGRCREPRDHPRVCGEHGHVFGVQHAGSGSSPRMRGTHVHDDCPVREAGIIPAYAGNTDILPLSARGYRDHPRVCGEHVVLRRVQCAEKGSSPRMRGTPRWWAMPAKCPGIIPAYAGNTRKIIQCDINRGDHPRVCGEHLHISEWRSAIMGSSPRMRGTPFIKFCAVSLLGIIPAYAGNTYFALFEHIEGQDHPRVCGEHTKRL